MPTPFVIFIVFIAIVIVLAIIGARQAKQRREALAAWAQSAGLLFNPEKDFSFDERFAGFHMLREGDNRYAYNILTGTHAGRGVCAFDYHYETHSTDSKGRSQTHHHRFSALIVETGLPLRPLVIRPEGVFDKMAGFFGFDDIDFESAQFSRDFYVKSPDRKWAFDVIQQPTMELLLASPKFTLEFAGSRILAARSGTFRVSDFQAALGLVEGVLLRMPEYLMRELKGTE